MIDNEKEWAKIEMEFSNNKTPSKPKKKVWDNPLQEKYHELTTRYSNEYGSDDGSSDCERLLDDMRAFERVFGIMKWNPQ